MLCMRCARTEGTDTRIAYSLQFCWICVYLSGAREATSAHSPRNKIEPIFHMFMHVFCFQA